MKKRVFIIGGGTSIKDQKLNWLAKEDTIAVNYAANNLSFNPTIFLTADSGVIKSFGQNNFHGLPKTTKKVVVINPKEHPRWNQVKDYVPLFDEHWYPTRWDGNFSLTYKDFATGKNTGFCAMQYAYLCGYEEIYLLGFDLTKKDGKKYFYGNGEGNDSPYEVFYKNFVQAFEILKNWPTECKIYSCSPISRLNEHIEYIPIEKLVPKMPVFISHFTNRTPYQEEVKHLIASLDKWELDYYIEGIESLGTWRANSNYCAKLTQKCMAMFDPRPVLRLDADAIIQQYPELFERKGFRADVAGCIYKESKMIPGGEFLGGTIYFGNSDMSKTLVDDWVELCEQKKNHRNGDLLYSIIKKTKGLSFTTMPLSYCKIFDYSNMGSDKPVIEHFQASRRFKKKINELGFNKK